MVLLLHMVPAEVQGWLGGPKWPRSHDWQLALIRARSSVESLGGNSGSPPCTSPHGCLCFLIVWHGGVFQEAKTEATAL